MAKLEVSVDLLVSALFERSQPNLVVRGASFDAGRNVVELDIVGPGVPECERVVAECHQRSFSVEFKPAP
ncbi:hypothetical protein [Variovorax ginsengisoli]|uniref:Uncharacterized protein n=1 Tax=Variovorax ginsengisoli TaxID=363844 RepID=A0ABT8SE29_9BURK|nr:hypothetical protein [Variovorax ginsengisoli]MDN8617865.1 hypothetical protein [Variovorax ginsengisoli]MDO1537035.1 hypothetical protein [Variovorax ginsengisoli]